MLKENKISASGKCKGKRWGSITKTKGGAWHFRICVQYDEYLDLFLAGESAGMRELVNTGARYEGCGRCLPGKCAATGVDLFNPTETQIELIEKLVKFRIGAIGDGRIPKCSYIKISERNEPIKPCAVCKVCDPKCRAMKKC